MMALLVGIFGAVSIPSTALAQSQGMPPEHYTLDPRGVDLVTGSFNFGTSDVVIGQPGVGGLVHARQYLEGWRDVEVGGLSMSGSDIVVATGMVSVTFVPDGSGGWKSKYDDGSTIELLTNGTYEVVGRDGSVATFTEMLDVSNYSYPYLVTNERSPDGRETVYHWKSICSNGAPPPCFFSFQMNRLQSITNNHGYQLKFFYDSNSVDPWPNWMRVTKVVGLNMAVDYCDPAADTCPTFTENWPSMTYTFVGPLTTLNPAPASTTDQSGRTTSYTYSDFRITSVRYPGATSDDIAVSYNASPDLRVNAVTDASGSWTYGYSTSGSNQTTSVAGPLSQSLTAVINMTTGRLTSATDALSNTWSYLYDSDFRTTRVTQPEGNYVTYAYDSRSNPTQTTHVPKPGSGLSNIVTSATFPSSCSNPVTCNLPTTTTDALGGVTDYSWDSTHGGLLSVTAPAPTGGAARPQTRFAYDDFQARYRDSASTFVNGSPIVLPIETSACSTGTSCDGVANEVLTTITYPTTSTPNNLLPVSTSRGSGTTPAMATTAMTYTPDGDVATVDGPLSGTADTVTYIYDDARQVIGMIGPDPDGGGALLNRAQRLTYNSRGQVTMVETGTASGGTWTNFAALLKSQTIYDAAQFFRPVESRQLSAADAVSSVRSITYDAAGRPSCTAIRMNPASYTSLPGSACTAATTGGYGPDRISQVTYDAVGRVLTTTSAYGTADAITESVTYTANGQTASLTDGNGNVSITEYDAFDRQVKLRYPNATGGGTSSTDYEAWTWNAAGQPVTSRNRAGQTTSFTWDLLGRVTEIDTPSGTMDITTTYDNLGRVLTLTGNGQTLTNVWDALSRPSSESGPLGTMAYQYDAASRMTRVTWPDTFYVKYGHDLYGAVTSVAENGATSGPGLLAQYAYDNLGQLTGIARADGAGAATAYSYDAFARLASLAQNPTGSTEDVTLGFSYNPAGQIAGRTVSNDAYVWTPATGGTGYALNGLNQVTQIDSASVTYDANRNATDIAGNDYGYDAANRLISADAGAGAATFAFDPGGRLYQSSVGGTSTRFQYTGAQMVGEYDGSGTIIARHIPGLGLDDIAASWDLSSTSPVRVWPLADERGSVIGRTSSITTVNRYDEYGVPASGNTGRFQYTGQAWLAEAGAYHYRARTYLPQSGRFLQTDPIGYGAGANLYAYVGADPVNLFDPLGLDGVHTSIGPAECRLLGGVFRRTRRGDVDHDTCVILPTFGRFGGLGGLSGFGGLGDGSDPTPAEQARACSTGIFRRYLGNPAWERQMAEAMRRARSTPSIGPGWARGSEFAFMSGGRSDGSIRIGNVWTDYIATNVFPKFGWQILWIGWDDIMVAHTHQFTDGSTSNSLSDGDFVWARGNNVAIMAERHNRERYCYDPNA